MHRRQNTQPAIRQGSLSRHQFRMLHQIGGGERCRHQEQQDDRHKGKGRDHQIESQRRQHTPVIQPRQKHDRQHDKGVVIQRALMPRQTAHSLHQKPHRPGIRRLQHGVGEHQIKPDVERHQRPDNVLGLGILPPRRRHRRCHL